MKYEPEVCLYAITREKLFEKAPDEKEMKLEQ